MPATLEVEPTLTDRYHITVPETARRALSLRKRDKIQYVIRPSDEVEPTHASDAEADDPALCQLLGSLGHDIASRPERLQSLSRGTVHRMHSLFGEVNVDLDTSLSVDDE